MIKVNNIEVAYAKVLRVLHGVSLKIEDGSIVALLGANGAGKSTTLKAISGLLHSEAGEVTDGSVEWNGVRIDNKSAEAIGKLGIIQALEGRRVFEHLTTEENLVVGGYSRRDRRAVQSGRGIEAQEEPDECGPEPDPVAAMVVIDPISAHGVDKDRNHAGQGQQDRRKPNSQ